MKAIGYVRVKPIHDDAKHLSCEVQERTIRDFAQSQGWEIIEVLTEAWSPLNSPEPPALRRVVAGRDAKWDVLLIARLDCLTRDVRQLVHMLDRIRSRQGRRLVSIEEGIDFASPGGQLCFRLAREFAAWDSHFLADRTRAMIARKREYGEPLGHPPFGYTYRGKQLVPLPSELDTVRVIQKLRASGMTFRKIAAYLNDRQVPAKRGGVWHQATVHAVIKRSTALMDPSLDMPVTGAAEGRPRPVSSAPTAAAAR